jgi:hypothetical protein
MKGKKTHAVAVVMILHALTAFALGHDQNLNVPEILAAFGMSALRSGIASGPTAGAVALAGLAFGIFAAPPLQAADTPAVAPPAVAPVPAAPKELATVTLTYAEPTAGRVYIDSGATLATSDFKTATYGYGLRVGYQVSKVWAVDLGVAHHGFDYDGNAIQDLSFRAVARLPFEVLSPYAFLGGRRNFERDEWTIEPGAGIEIGVSRRLRGLSLYAEGMLRADTRGKNDYGFGAGVRFRF